MPNQKQFHLETGLFSAHKKHVWTAEISKNLLGFGQCFVFFIIIIYQNW